MNYNQLNNNLYLRLLSSAIDYILKSERLSSSLLFCHIYILKFTSYSIEIWIYIKLFSNSIISGLPTWLTKSHYFISIHRCFYSKENRNLIILHFICSDEIFWCIRGSPYCYMKRLHGIVFVIAILF